MKNYINSNIGRLRLLAFLEGVSLLILVLIGVPLKYLAHSEGVVKVVGPIHGLLFVLFLLNALSVALAEKGSSFVIIAKLFIASFIPFGTFYVDAKILKPIHLRLLATQEAVSRNP